MLQSNDTAILQNGVQRLCSAVTELVNALPSAFSAERFFNNKQFHDMIGYVSEMNKNVSDMGNVVAGNAISTGEIEKGINDIKDGINRLNENSLALKTYGAEANKTNMVEVSNLSELNGFEAALENFDGLGNIEETDNLNILNLMQEFFTKSLTYLDNMASDSFKIYSNIDSKILPYLDAIMVDNFNSYSLIKNLTDKYLSDNLPDEKSKIERYDTEQKEEEQIENEKNKTGLIGKIFRFLDDKLVPLLTVDETEQITDWGKGILATFLPTVSVLWKKIADSKFITGALKFFKSGGAFIAIALGATKFYEGISKAVEIIGHEIDWSSLEGWLEAIKLGFTGVISGIFGVNGKKVYGYINNVDMVLRRTFDTFVKPVIGQVWKNIVDALKEGWGFVKNVGKKIWDDFKNTEFAKNITSFGKAIYDFIDTGLEPVKPLIKWFFENIQSVIETVKKALGVGKGGLVDDIAGSFKSAFDVVTSPIETLIDILEHPIDNINYVLTSIYRAVGGMSKWLGGMSWEDAFKSIDEEIKFGKFGSERFEKEKALQELENELKSLRGSNLAKSSFEKQIVSNFDDFIKKSAHFSTNEKGFYDAAYYGEFINSARDSIKQMNDEQLMERFEKMIQGISWINEKTGVANSPDLGNKSYEKIAKMDSIVREKLVNLFKSQNAGTESQIESLIKEIEVKKSELAELDKKIEAQNKPVRSLSKIRNSERNKLQALRENKDKESVMSASNQAQTIVAQEKQKQTETPNVTVQAPITVATNSTNTSNIDTGSSNSQNIDSYKMANGSNQ